MSFHDISDVGFVLHRHAYRETSAIVDVFTRDHGRINVVVKGVRAPKSKLKTVLHPFVLLQIQCRGKSTLKNLQCADPLDQCYRLAGTALMSGLYLNELLTRLLYKDEEHTRLFECYSHALRQLNEGHAIEPILRSFENQFLSAIGYALPFTYDAESHAPIQGDGYYRFINEHGFVPVSSSEKNQLSVFLGVHLSAIANDDFSDKHVLSAAKRLFRIALQPLLGNKPLISREIMMAMV